MELNGFVGSNKEALDLRFAKYLVSLRKPTKKSKDAVQMFLQKSQKRFSEQYGVLESEEQKLIIQKKLETISNQLEMLKKLAEDDIPRFALTTQKNMMAVAANPRTPKVERMMARVACHKPLSTHLARVKRKLNESVESDSEEEQATATAEGNTSTTLNKIILNNQIVKMKKDVKRAKVHIVHKLTRNIAKLRSSKGNEKNKAKRERKAERMVKKIACIKELDDNDISVFALTSTQDLAKLSTDIKASLKTQTLAAIAIHKFVKEPVADFKKRFPDWQKTVPVILKKKKKKRKLNLETKENDKISNKKPVNKLTRIDNQKDNESSNEESEGSNEDEEIDESGDDFDKESDSEDESNDEDKIDAVERVNNQEMSDDSENYNSGEVQSDMESESSERPSKKLGVATKGLKRRLKTPSPINKNPESVAKKQKINIKVKTDKVRQNSNVSKPTVNTFKITDSPFMASITKSMDEEVEQSDESGSSNGSQSIVECLTTNQKPLRKVVPLNSLKSSKDTMMTPSNKIKATNVKKLIKRTNSDKTEDPLTSPSKFFSKPDLNENRPKVVDSFFVTASNEEYVTSQVPVEIEDSGAKWKANNEDFNSTKVNGFNNFNSERKQGKLDNRRTIKFRNHETKPYQKPIANSFEKVPNSRPNALINLGNRKERRKALQKSFQEEKVEKLHPSWEAKKKNSTLATFQGKKITFE